MCPLYASDVISNVASSASNFRKNSTFVPVSEFSSDDSFGVSTSQIKSQITQVMAIVKLSTLREALIRDTRLKRETVVRKLFHYRLKEEHAKIRLNAIKYGTPYVMQNLTRLVSEDLTQ